MKALRSTQRVRENSDSIPVLKKLTFRWGKMDIYTSNYIRGPPKFQCETILILAQSEKDVTMESTRITMSSRSGH